MDGERFSGSGLRSKESQRIIRHRLESPPVKICPDKEGSAERRGGGRGLDEQLETVHSLRFYARAAAEEEAGSEGRREGHRRLRTSVMIVLIASVRRQAGIQIHQEKLVTLSSTTGMDASEEQFRSSEKRSSMIPVTLASMKSEEYPACLPACSASRISRVRADTHRGFYRTVRAVEDLPWGAILGELRSVEVDDGTVGVHGDASSATIAAAAAVAAARDGGRS
jgi:hypothetical protein